MPEPLSPLAELRALEAKRTAGGLTPAEERRLAELKAQNAPPAPRGFDIGAAAAAVREAAALGGAPGAVPLPAPPVLDTGAIGPSTPPLPVAPRPPESLLPLPPEALAPLPGAETLPPDGFDVTAPPPPSAHEEIGLTGYDVVPAFETPSADAAPTPGAPDWSSWVETAASTAPAIPPGGAELEASPEAAPAEGQEQPEEPGADAQTWDPNAQAQWDPNQPQTWDPSAQAQWDPNQPQTWDPNAQAQWDPNQPQTWDPNGTVRWDPAATSTGESGAAWAGTIPEPAPPEPAPPVPAAAEPLRKPGQTASWDLSGATTGPALPPGAPDPTIPDEGDPGATAVWSVSQVLPSRGGPLPRATPATLADDDVEPVILDEIHLESGGSFGPPTPAGGFPPPPAPPAALEPPQAGLAAPASGPSPAEAMEVDDDQILEVGGDVQELVGDDLPTVEAVEEVLAGPAEQEGGAIAALDLTAPPAAAPAAGHETPLDLFAGLSLEPEHRDGPALLVEEHGDRPLVGLEALDAAPPYAAPGPEAAAPHPSPEPAADPFAGIEPPSEPAVEARGEGAPLAVPAPALAEPAVAPEAFLPPPPQPGPAAGVTFTPEPPAPGVTPEPLAALFAAAPALAPEPPPAPQPTAERPRPAPAPVESPPLSEPEPRPLVLPVASAPPRSFVPPPGPVVAPSPPAAAVEPPPPPGEPVSLDALSIDEAPLEEPPARPPPAPAPATRVIAGVHRVVVHTVEGQVKRGQLADPDLGADRLSLLAQAGAAPELLPADRVRAIFFMLGANESPAAPSGLKVRVTFRDGRQVAGFSPDYDPQSAGFFMVPADTRTNTARIWVYRKAVRQVSVS